MKDRYNLKKHCWRTVPYSNKLVFQECCQFAFSPMCVVLCSQHNTNFFHSTFPQVELAGVFHILLHDRLVPPQEILGWIKPIVLKKLSSRKTTEVKNKVLFGAVNLFHATSFDMSQYANSAACTGLGKIEWHCFFSTSGI